jgi:hypothetical protein
VVDGRPDDRGVVLAVDEDQDPDQGPWVTRWFMSVCPATAGESAVPASV